MNVLQQKVYGIPVPVIALGLGAILYLLFFRGKTGATANAAAAGSQLSSGYGLGYAQGLQAAAPGSPGPAPTGPSSTAVNASDWVRSGSGYWYKPNGQDGVFTLAGQQYYHLADPGAANSYVQGGGTTYFFPAPGLPAPFPWSSNTTGATPGTAIYGVRPVASGGVGGPARGKSIGSRSANLMHYSHPLVGARVPYSFHMRAVGGAPNHSREVLRAAHQAGVHPARVMMLNPDPHYPGRSGDHIRVA